MNQQFPAIYRIRQQRDFDRVYGNDVFATDAVLVIRGAENELPYSRLGLSVSRKVGNAVVRNRWKRLIREAFRRDRERLPVGFDFVVRPRRGAKPAFVAIQRSLPKLCHQLVGRMARTK